jgi:hypothetical protein
MWGEGTEHFMKWLTTGYYVYYLASNYSKYIYYIDKEKNEQVYIGALNICERDENKDKYTLRIESDEYSNSILDLIQEYYEHQHCYIGNKTYTLIVGKEANKLEVQKCPPTLWSSY